MLVVDGNDTCILGEQQLPAKPGVYAEGPSSKGVLMVHHHLRQHEPVQGGKMHLTEERQCKSAAKMRNLPQPGARGQPGFRVRPCHRCIAWLLSPSAGTSHCPRPGIAAALRTTKGHGHHQQMGFKPPVPIPSGFSATPRWDPILQHPTLLPIAQGTNSPLLRQKHPSMCPFPITALCNRFTPAFRTTGTNKHHHIK